MRAKTGDPEIFIPKEVKQTLKASLTLLLDIKAYKHIGSDKIQEALEWLESPSFSLVYTSLFPEGGDDFKMPPDDVTRPAAYGRHQLDEFYLDASKEPPVGHRIVVQIICPHQEGLVDSYRGMEIRSSKNSLLHTEIGADPYEVVVNCRRWAWTHDYGWETHVSVGLYLELYEKSKDDIVF